VNLLRRVAAVLVGTALFGLAMWFYTIQPDLQARRTDPVRTTGTAGEEVANPVFSVRVQRVDVARSLKSGSSLSGAREFGTDGIFVIVDMQLKSNKEPFRLQTTHLETPGGYDYSSGPRLGLSDLVAISYEPLIWARAVVVFEIPKNRLAGARIVIGESKLLNQLSAETAVDLGIGKAKAADLIAHATNGYELRRS
jgi:hypothetical protein